MALGAVVFGRQEVDQLARLVDAKDIGDFPLALGQGDGLASGDRKQPEMRPAGLVRDVNVVLLLGLADGPDVRHGEQVIQPSVRAVALTNCLGPERGHIHSDDLLPVLHAVERLDSHDVMLPRQPRHLADDQLLCVKGVDRDRRPLAGTELQQVQLDGRVRLRHLGIPQLQLAWVRRRNLLVVHVVRHGEGWDTGLIEPQEGEVRPVRREPERKPVAEDLLLVDPVRDAIEEIRPAVIGNLASRGIGPDEDVVVADKGDGVAGGTPLSVLDVAGLVWGERSQFHRLHVLDKVVGKVRVPVLLGVVGSPEHGGEIGMDPVAVGILWHFVRRDEGLRVVGDDALDFQTAVLVLVDIIPILGGRNPLDRDGRGGNGSLDDRLVEGQSFLAASSRGIWLTRDVNGGSAADQKEN